MIAFSSTLWERRRTLPLNRDPISAGILLIVLVFALAKTPTWITGWGFIVLGIVTIVIGITGLFTKPRKSYGMFAVHVSISFASPSRFYP